MLYLIASDLFRVFLDGLDDFSGTHGTPLVICTALVHTQQFLYILIHEANHMCLTHAETTSSLSVMYLLWLTQLWTSDLGISQIHLLYRNKRRGQA